MNWETIRSEAIKSGFKPNTLDQWKFRGSIPKHAQIKIFKATRGAVSFEDMDLSKANPPNQRVEEN